MSKDCIPSSSFLKKITLFFTGTSKKLLNEHWVDWFDQDLFFTGTSKNLLNLKHLVDWFDWDLLLNLKHLVDWLDQDC